MPFVSALELEFYSFLFWIRSRLSQRHCLHTFNFYRRHTCHWSTWWVVWEGPSPARRLFTSPLQRHRLDSHIHATVVWRFQYCNIPIIHIVAGYMLLPCTPVDNVFASWSIHNHPPSTKRILKHFFQTKCDGEQVRVCLTNCSVINQRKPVVLCLQCVCVEWSQAVWLWYTHQSTNRWCRNPIAGYHCLSL